ncbi:adenylyl cyclase-associated protein 2 isoform X2 [Clupea harengus]|uniref:Adenylyl cyclase-associated protein n=1 Tax=Clupea harengus TaxID=7950 RepID=A0A6P8GU21_CLUHA|nr:adenylyl cyclase-associated protein 2 isoform X2 [Clupea harengus]
MERLVERLENAVIRLEKVSVKLQGQGMANGDILNGINGALSEWMEAFDVLLKGPVAEYMKHSRAIGDDVAQHAEMVNNALQVERAFLKMASTHQEPAQMELADLLRPVSEQIQEVQSFREKHRGSSLFNHLSAVSESIPALGWVAMGQKPGPYVKEMNDAAIFYTNRVLKDYKDSDPRHVDWVHSYLSIWTEMQLFIKQYHATGLAWSSTGPMAPASLSSHAHSGPCPPPPPPPPPPGPPPVFTNEEGPKQDAPAAQRSALFAALNQGEAITKGLKHVGENQKTHKNPVLRTQGGSQQASPSKSKHHGSSKKKQNKKHPPLLELEGKKWRVEYYEQTHDLIIDETELKQVVYIFSCNNSTIHIKGKVNSIIMDNCKKLGLVFDNAVGIVEVINSKDVKLQVMGKVPTMSINKTEGCQVYLSKEALDCEIVSAKSSEMNILIPQGDDYKEFPVPEQFKTVWDGSRLVTEPTEIAG